jgi:polysaccharide chain length determinant protein (PEP-CTERM system associated)
MLPGKKYKPEDILQVLRRRFWLLLVPLALVAAGTAAIARKLPDRYRSETLILVVPQRVPENYIKSTVTTRIEDRLQAIQQQIMSRTRLERIIQDFNLYAAERRTGIMEDIVQKMRERDIQIRIIKGDAFSVAYTGAEPRTVMKVAERLGGLFIEESLRDRETLAEGTNQFLETQLEDAKRRLAEQEKKLETYKLKYAGELPTQLESNLQALQGIQAQVQSLGESLNRDQDRRLLLERQIGELEAMAAPAAVAETPVTPSIGNDGAAAPRSAAATLANARAYLSNLINVRKLTDQHPDVVQAKQIVGDLEIKANEEALAVPLSAAPALSPLEIGRRRRLAELQIDHATLTRQMAQKVNEVNRLRGQEAAYGRRVEVVPVRETEMVELNRDYETVRTLYTDLLSKRESAKLSANLERQQIGEQFKLLDQARLPERPFSPDRQQINLFGILGGLAVGIGLIALLEYRDASFKTDEEVARLLELPVLAVVPVMQSEVERRVTRRRRWLMHTGLATTVAGCLAVLVYTFVR